MFDSIDYIIGGEASSGDSTDDGEEDILHNLLQSASGEEA